MAQIAGNWPLLRSRRYSSRQHRIQCQYRLNLSIAGSGPRSFLSIAGLVGVLPTSEVRPLTQASVEQLVPVASRRPLCVDLDGTLVKSDTLVDSLLALVRTRPRAALRIPGWILGGKANLKAQVASSVALDVAHLPYNRALLDYLQQQRSEGRKLYLTTGADVRIARRVAAYLGIFEEVLASDGSLNLTGGNKLHSLQARFPQQGFDYVGNASPDLPLLAAAHDAMIANPDLRLQSSLRSRGITVSHTFEDRPAIQKTFLKAIRAHQWAKNTLLFVPMLLGHVATLHNTLVAALAFLSFSLVASSTYIMNDLLDIEADRRHPRKRYRPFASGNLSAAAGLLIVIVFLLAAAVGSRFLPLPFTAWLALYFVSTLAYSLSFKKLVLVDVIILSGLYTLRILAGGAATSVPISPWLTAFAIFLFLSLSMVKRFSELQTTRASGTTPSNGRGYQLGDIEQLRSFGTASGYASVVVLALYISSPMVMTLYRHPERVWLMTPLLILWISRVWLLASRGELDEDPVVFALTDRTSLVIGALTVFIIAMAL